MRAADCVCYSYVAWAAYSDDHDVFIFILYV